MSWRSWSGEFIERVVAFHVKHCGVDRFAGWLFESVVSSLLVVGVSRGTVVVMVLGVLLGIGDGAFNGVFHVKRGSLFGMICWISCCGFERWNRISLTVE